MKNIRYTIKHFLTREIHVEVEHFSSVNYILILLMIDGVIMIHKGYALPTITADCIETIFRFMDDLKYSGVNLSREERDYIEKELFEQI